jgi:hypothetical protein
MPGARPAWAATGLPPGTCWGRAPRVPPAGAAAVRARGAFWLVLCDAVEVAFPLLIAEALRDSSTVRGTGLPLTMVIHALGWGSRCAGWISLE